MMGNPSCIWKKANKRTTIMTPRSNINSSFHQEKAMNETGETDNIKALNNVPYVSPVSGDDVIHIYF